MRALSLRFAVALFLLSFAATAQKLSDEALHRPSRQPDRVILTFAGADPTRSAAVAWRTDTTVKKAVAEIAEAGDGPKFGANQTIEAASEDFRSDLGEARMHQVRFANLKPDTLYAYRVGDGSNWTEWHQFRTASAKPGPVTLLYVGDAQTDIFSMWSRLIRMGYAHAPQANFIVHAGDLVNRSERDAEWGEWFRAAGWIHSTIPSFPVPGNHEYGKGPTGREITKHWRAQFSLPENGLPGLEETNYYVDYQGVRMIGLNSNLRLDEQAKWLDQLLSNNPNRWTIVTFHHPVFSAARGRDNKDLRSVWQPVFDKHKVDLVLTGHDHTYARTNLVSGVNRQQGNTVYVVSVSGTKMYGLDRQSWMARAAEDTQLFQVIRIDGDRLRYESRTARGVLYDAFELAKRAGKPNELINKLPATPERRRSAAPAGSTTAQ